MSLSDQSSPPATPPGATATPPGATEEDYGLTTPEEVANRRRRRLLAIWGVAAVLLIVLGVFAARPALGAVKIWQARRVAATSLRLLDAGKPEEAVSKLQDAMSLRGSDPEVMRAAAIFLTRIGRGREALGFWKELEKGRTLTGDEQRNYAADSLLVGDPLEANKRLRQAWPAGATGTPADWYLGMQIAARQRDATNAVALAHRLLDDKGKRVADRERLDAALMLLNVNEPKANAAGEAALHAIADGGQPQESLRAVLILLQQSSQMIVLARERHQTVPEANVQELLKLAAQLEKHPLAKVAQQLVTVEARMVAQPEQREALLQQAVTRYGQSKENDDLAALGAWLYAQGQFERIVELITPERSIQSRALYLQYLDALGALGRWQDIRRAIEGQRFTLEPMIEQMYLARCATQLGQPEASTLHWNAALQAAGTNPDKLLNLGHYAQGGGAAATAEAAFRAAAKAVPEDRPAREALLALLETQGRTRDTWEAIGEMLGVWPGDAAVRNDFAYLGALLGENLQADRATARDLVREEPTSLPHRIALALAELRLGHNLTALETLQTIDVGAFASQPRFQAVYADVLWETGYLDDARKIAAKIAIDRLLPEERQLLVRLQDAPTVTPHD